MKKQTVKIIILLALALILAFGCVGCATGNGAGGQDNTCQPSNFALINCLVGQASNGLNTQTYHP